MLSFLHSADWQIGKPYARVKDPDKRARLRQVRLEVIAGIGRHAQDRQAAFLVVAGDLFDSPTPSGSDVSAVCQAIGNLGFPVLVIPGNHDHGAPGSVWHSSFFRSEQQRRAPNLQVLLNRQVLELEQVIVLPCPLLGRSDSDDPCAWLRQIAWAD
jgi:DNA repair exonuclease SbcCD nuclease subunit